MSICGVLWDFPLSVSGLSLFKTQLTKDNRQQTSGGQPATGISKKGQRGQGSFEF